MAGVRGHVPHAAAPRVTYPRVGRPLGVDAGVGERLDLTRVEVVAQDSAEVAGDIGDNLIPLEGGFSACFSLVLPCKSFNSNLTNSSRRASLHCAGVLANASISLLAMRTRDLLRRVDLHWVGQVEQRRRGR